MGGAAVDNGVSVRQRLEELKSYVYDELNLLISQIRKSNCVENWDNVQKLPCSYTYGGKAVVNGIDSCLQNKYKRERHMRAYCRAHKSSGRKYKRKV